MLKHTNLETLVKRCAAFRKVYARISAPELKHYQLSPSEVDILISYPTIVQSIRQRS